jgi:hypothetical protein
MVAGLRHGDHRVEADLAELMNEMNVTGPGSLVVTRR